jgi:LysR family nitrogen assimilation transcriptional regulator
LDVKHLRYFIAIAEEGSLSAASQRLGVAQPSLSQHVIRIEQELGVTIVSRSPRGVVLTESGMVLLRHAREICASMTACMDAVRQSGGTPHGLVALGLPPSVSMVLSVPLAQTVRLTLPQVKLQVMEAMSGFIKKWLDDGTVDLGFLYDVEEVRHHDIDLLMSEDLHVFSTREDWPLAAPPGEPVPLAEVAKLQLVLPSQRHGLRKTIDRFARDAGLELDVFLEMDALSQIKDLVLRGSAFTILAPAAALDCVDRGELVSSRIVDPPMTRPVYLARNKARPETMAARRLQLIIHEVVADLVRRGIWKSAQPHAG